MTVRVEHEQCRNGAHLNSSTIDRICSTSRTGLQRNGVINDEMIPNLSRGCTTKRRPPSPPQPSGAKRGAQKHCTTCRRLTINVGLRTVVFVIGGCIMLTATRTKPIAAAATDNDFQDKHQVSVGGNYNGHQPKVTTIQVGADATNSAAEQQAIITTEQPNRRPQKRDRSQATSKRSKSGTASRFDSEDRQQRQLGSIAAKVGAIDHQQAHQIGQHEQRPINDADLNSFGDSPQLSGSYKHHQNRPSASLGDYHTVVGQLPSVLDDEQHLIQPMSGGFTSNEPTSKQANIRVVFNNNPHFIIGSNTAGRESLGPVLQRKTRQPSPGLYDDQYSQDESAPGETKALPCADQKKSHDLQPRIEDQVNLLDDPVKTNTQQPDEPKISTGKSKPPPIEQQQRQHVQQDEQQVDTPFDQIVKSGLRPPLRMVISMQNKHGDVMKVPINLHGSDQGQQHVQLQEPAHKQTTTFELGPQMQFHFEKPTLATKSVQQQQSSQIPDENTPSGGDIFDPSLAKPFATKTSRGKTTTQTVQQRDKTNGEGGKTRAAPDLAQAKEDCQQQEAGDGLKGDGKGTKAVQDQQQVDAPTKSNPEHHQAAILPPVALSPNGEDGLVQMMVPQLTQFQNKTFANMISEFQRALGEQMTKHLNGQAIKSASDQQSKQQQQRQQQQDDEQDDMVVAMMAANMGRQPGAANWRGGQIFQGANQQQVSMTVIRPPKGTSIKDAVLNHAKEGQTMAIISSRLPDGDTQASLTGGAQKSNRKSTGDSVKPVGFDIVPRPPFNGVSRRPPVQAPPPPPSPTSPPVRGTDQPEPAGVDPDGFSSSASSSASLSNPSSIELDSFEEIASGHLQLPFGWQHTRFKRDTSDQQRHHHLEADDKLSSRSNETKEKGRVASSGNSTTTTTGKPSLSTTTTIATTKTQAKRRQVKKKHQKGLATKTSLLKRFGQPRPTPSPDDQADHFLAAASQHNDVSSSDNSDEDEDSDEDDMSGGGGGGGDSSSSSADNSDEPSASASGEGGESSSGNAADDGDYGGDMADDFDDSTAFDGADDEPYNQAAASDRDYSGASSSFEIPSIDINPNTLQQKGCRTVLREVQEIPLNGLGAVQANGQPGSGFQTDQGDQSGSDTSQVAGLRVKRQSGEGGGNSNLINSRKVTSIVMTKECHFPNDQSADNGSAQSLQTRRRQPVAARTSEQPANSFYGNQGGASQMRPSIATHPKPQVAVSQASKFPTYQLVQEQPAIMMQPQQQQQQQQRKAAQPLPIVQSINFYQQQRPPAMAPVSAAKHSGQPQQAILTKFYESNVPVQKRPSAKGQLVKYQMAPATQQQSDQLGASSSSTIKRRSVGPMTTQRPAAAPSKTNLKPPNSFRGAIRDNKNNNNKDNKEDGFMNGAASGVVAKKLYKPPSDDDPYHTLSYSSQTGADPDMDQDEDDSAVMGADEAADSQPLGDESQRDSARKHPTGTLSEREREALMDPNHDDTDPVRPGGRSRSSGSENLDRPDPMDEADENDGDMMDETRTKQHRQKPSQPQAASGSPSHAQRRSSPSDSHQPNYHQRQHSNSYRPPLQPPQRQPPVDRRRSYDDSSDDETDQQAGSATGPPRFGKSFKFEHELSRPSGQQQQQQQPFNTAQQLRQLSPGLKGYVDTNGHREPAKASHLASQLGALATTPLMSRRQDMDDDDDDDDDDDGGGEAPRGRGGSGRRNAAASSRERSRAPAPDDPDENPDADPEMNPRETHLPAHSKPKKFEKSFAYVHRDLPKKGARNPDDFLVTYGRGNLQTEHEDYDSDRDPNNNHPPASDDEARAASDVRQQTLQRGPSESGGHHNHHQPSTRAPPSPLGRRSMVMPGRVAGGFTATGYGMRQGSLQPSRANGPRALPLPSG